MTIENSNANSNANLNAAPDVDPESKFLKDRIVSFIAGDGLKLVGETAGTLADCQNKPPVVLLHGGGQTRHAWKKTQQALASAGIYSIAMDLRGHGESDWSASGNYTATSFTEDLKLVVDSLPAPTSSGGCITGRHYYSGFSG